MDELWRCLKAEGIKAKMDWPILVAVLAPIGQVLFLFLVFFYSEDRVLQFGTGYRGWFQVNLQSWTGFFLPMSLAILVYQVWETERQAQGWRHLFALPIPTRQVLAAKMLMLLIYLTISSLLLWGAVVGLGKALAHFSHLRMGTPDWGRLGSMILVSWVGALPLVTFHAALAQTRLGLGGTLGVALGGLILCAQAASGSWLVALLPWGPGPSLLDVSRTLATGVAAAWGQSMVFLCVAVVLFRIHRLHSV